MNINVRKEEKRMEGARAVDRRVRRTRALLEDGLLELLGEKDLDHIAMREVCRRADVATATPYAHYRDVVDILGQMEARLEGGVRAILAEHPREEGVTAALLSALFSLAVAERGLCKALVCQAADEAFTRRLRMRLEEDLAARLAAGPAAAMRAAFCMGGCWAVLRTWLAEGCPEPPEKMAALLLPMLG